MTQVLIERSSLEKGVLERKVRQICQNFLGPGLAAGTTVLLKPHLHMAVAAKTAVNTHPMIIAAVARWCLDQNARVKIADFPMFDPVDTIARKGGYLEQLAPLDIDIRSFLTTTKVELGKFWGKKPLARQALESDVVINLPKLKTDPVLGLHLAVANMLGCMPAEDRLDCLARAGFDRQVLADLMIAVCRKVKPALTIMDAVLALEGGGPGGAGKPRSLELLVAGTDPHGVDKTAAALVGLNPEDLLLCRRARETGVFNGVVRVRGDLTITPDFKKAVDDHAGKRVDWGRRSRKYLLQRPVVDNRRCKLCSACWKCCPAGAISFSTKGVRIDPVNCIRCYLCFVLCPHKALAIKTPLAGRLKYGT